ncbi:RAS small monomeric GTPase [Aspergillus sclerotialis]|uniref:RAS small monomeric GTPase n=1 Tax=Aspergillus sclerotialis TaxID=2070753 RepID=A0A3A2ZZ77_9EURO|nr:RAS small monomeric GTPase [Aspergillus sclerotialis]
MADKISITICGDGGCGKSSVTLRLVRSQWVHEYDPTIEDSYSVTRTIDGLPYLLSITDTAGQEEYRGLWQSANLKSDAFLLVYDITNEDSLSALDFFMDMLNIESERRIEDNNRLLKELGDSAHGLEVGMPPPVKIVAGNKCDLKDARVVPARDGLEYARKHGCGFMETSAREMVNIEETFALLVRRVVEARRLHYQRGPANPPAGTSTAKTPALTDGEGSRNKKSKGGRRIRFLGLGKGEDAEDGRPKPTRKSLWRRLRCW